MYMSTNGEGADVIIVGAGHNGLTAGCYLAKAGLDVLVVEAGDQVGGMTATNATLPEAPEHRFNEGAIQLTGIFRLSGIAEELDLPTATASRRSPSTRRTSSWAPTARRSASGRTASGRSAELARFSRKDAQAWRELSETLDAIMPAILAYMQGHPTRVAVLRHDQVAGGDRTAAGQARAAAALHDGVAHRDARRAVRDRAAEGRAGRDGRVPAHGGRHDGRRRDHLPRRRPADPQRDAGRRHRRSCRRRCGAASRPTAGASAPRRRSRRSSSRAAAPPACAWRAARCCAPRHGVMSACNVKLALTRPAARGRAARAAAQARRRHPGHQDPGDLAEDQRRAQGQAVDAALRGAARGRARPDAASSSRGTRSRSSAGLERALPRRLARDGAGLLLASPRPTSTRRRRPRARTRSGCGPASSPCTRASRGRRCATRSARRSSPTPPQYYDGLDSLEIGRTVLGGPDLEERFNAPWGNVYHVDPIPSRFGPLKPALGLGAYKTPVDGLYLQRRRHPPDRRRLRLPGKLAAQTLCATARNGARGRRFARVNALAAECRP